MQVGAEVQGELFFDLLTSVFAQQSVVNEDARQLITDGFGDEGGDDRGVNATGEAADDAVGADDLADALFLLFDERADLPCPVAAADFADEIGQQLSAKFGVSDFRVELKTEDLPIAMSDGGIGAGGRGREGLEFAGE